MKVLFATNNINKLKEVESKLGHLKIEIISLNYFKDYTEVKETKDTFHGNAYLKAKYFYDKYNIPVLSDDSGLVCCYNNLPGVKSKRFAHDSSSDLENNMKLIDMLKNATNRDAYFITVLCFIHNDEVNYFEGRLNGSIGYDLVGENGFGYDPLFVVGNKRLAEMTIQEKNSISHRAKAIDNWIMFLNNMEDESGK